ncbi:phosphatidylinositol 3-kinase VPS34A [Guillardia theta CCMP2712]|uniref:Phosphatidylinositol 3-kinase VPS34A n=1 Tax=Guillardia theta (strain CCMP2712) TaxID=905079 RepID=L1IIA9_GUITC|nr:phosphatidylinositol 3-kinase VPS34A [Guillardia theta CCMP2712]EKX35812.1 phosphatidylinositol 3-kinase VPS34A [Guillardia theta CCMP2712]|eukprot:XP_005822792.1 phosphatidylinositol 3-kinase VPS34A [Guillardia theta CCMP2712]
MATLPPPSSPRSHQRPPTHSDYSQAGRIWSSLGFLLDYRPQKGTHSQDGGILDLTAVGLGRFWRNSGEQKDKNLPGYSPHLIYKVNQRVCSLLMEGDEVASVDGEAVSERRGEELCQLLTEKIDKVKIIRRMAGDNWGVTSRNLDVVISVSSSRSQHVRPSLLESSKQDIQVLIKADQEASRVQRAGEGTHSERVHLPEESFERNLKGERRERLTDREKREEEEEEMKIFKGGESAMSVLLSRLGNDLHQSDVAEVALPSWIRPLMLYQPNGMNPLTDGIGHLHRAITTMAESSIREAQLQQQQRELRVQEEAMRGRRIGLESSHEAESDGKAYDSAEDLLRLEAIGTGRVQCKRESDVRKVRRSSMRPATLWHDDCPSLQVLELVDGWVELEVDDALELLGSNYSVVPIRSLAIRSLDKARCEEGRQGRGREGRGQWKATLTELAQVSDAELMCFLMPLTIALRYDVVDLGEQEDGEEKGKEGTEEEEEAVGMLAKFLIRRSLRNSSIAMAFYWHLVVERSCGGNFSRMYRRVHALLSRRLQASQMLFDAGGGGVGGSQSSWKGLKVLEVVRQQEHFVASLSALVAEVRKHGKLSRLQQVERLREAISPEGNLSHLADLAVPVRLPNQSHVVVSGIIADKTTILKSAMMPIKLQRSPSRPADHRLHRPDGHAAQARGVDLNIITYRVTATSHNQGLVEWVEDSYDLQHILDEFADIRLFFQAHDPTNRRVTAEQRAERRNNPFASILASGSPGPDAAAERAKFSEEILDKFKVCCKAYLILRQHARTFLNLLDLSRDLNANQNALSFRSGQELEERFQLHLTPQEAVTYLQEVIHESVGALFPQLVDTVHKWRQFFKQ